MKFSIITVSYNPGEKLRETLSSVALQSCTDYEVIVKDGGSTDGSADFLKEARDAGGEVETGRGSGDLRRTGQTADGLEGEPAQEDALWRTFLRCVRFFEGKDAGIYDAMNQAAALAEGEYILFLNCGDTLADRETLARTAAAVEKAAGKAAGTAAGMAGAAERRILYGDTISRKTGATIISPPRIDGFACYRNIPCHQSCFYSAALCREKPFDLRYRIRADYDHFLWCFYQGGAEFVPLGFSVSSYEGGGYSESRENAARDKAEHREIAGRYMSGFQLFGCRAAMALTLAPLRSKMADSRCLSGLYHWMKSMLYGRRQTKILP